MDSISAFSRIMEYLALSLSTESLKTKARKYNDEIFLRDFDWSLVWYPIKIGDIKYYVSQYYSFFTIQVLWILHFNLDVNISKTWCALLYNLFSTLWKTNIF